MRHLTTIWVFLFSMLFAQELSVPLDNAKWSAKDNTTVVAEEPECFCVTIDPAQHGFGWITRGLPADTANYAGIYGRFRTNARRGRLAASLLLPGASTTEYYTQPIGTFSDSTGDWVDFYLSWDGFQPAQNARSAFAPRRLNDKARLQFTFVDLAAEERPSSGSTNWRWFPKQMPRPSRCVSNSALWSGCSCPRHAPTPCRIRGCS